MRSSCELPPRRSSRPRRSTSPGRWIATRPIPPSRSTCSPARSHPNDLLSDLGAEDVEEELLVRHGRALVAADGRRRDRGHLGSELAGTGSARGRRRDRSTRPGRERSRRAGRLHDRVDPGRGGGGHVVVRARLLRGVRRLARADRAGGAVRRAREAPRAAGVARRLGGGRSDDARRVLAGRIGDPGDVRARRRGRVPVVHDRAAGAAGPRGARPRDDRAQHGVDPTVGRLSRRDAEARGRQVVGPRGDLAHVPLRHRRVPGRIRLGRRLDPASSRAEREPEEVLGRDHPGRARHDDRVDGARDVVRRRLRRSPAGRRRRSAS